ncbi:MAG: sporulation initiation factor Spo0A C-terminal domain-containing protein [Anaerobutyricum sp.]
MFKYQLVRVERNIRHAIEVAFKREFGDRSKDLYLFHQLTQIKGHPTEF